MAVYFTADTHFFHHNIIKYCNRPFRNVAEMNAAMIARWNAQVGKGDRVYHLGDVSFGGLAETFRLLAELNGEICLVSGNHDDELGADPYLQERFHWIKPYPRMAGRTARQLAPLRPHPRHRTPARRGAGRRHRRPSRIPPVVMGRNPRPPCQHPAPALPAPQPQSLKP